MNSARVSNPISHQASGLGAGLHGGRPTFALRKQENEFTMYELLPAEQARAHKERWGANRMVNRTVKVMEPTFLGDDLDWNGWKAVKIATLGNDRFNALRSLLKDVVQGTEHEYVDILEPGDWEMLLPEASGVKISLAFVAIKPLQRIDKQRACARRIERMSIEECYYWHSLCRSPSTPNGSKALRTLLTAHLR